MTDSRYRDFIPDGEDTGAITKDGFQDFVPEPTPQHHADVTPDPLPEPVQPVQQSEPAPVVPPLDSQPNLVDRLNPFRKDDQNGQS